LAFCEVDLLAYPIALAYTGLGNDDQAFAWLERGVAQAGSLGMRVESGFRRLQTDPRWERLASGRNGMRAAGR
jgi:hypothetical protein